MKSSLRRICAASLAIAALAMATTRAAEIWVATNGDDTNPGTAERPVASVAMAQRKARELRRLADLSATDGVRIVVRGGVYPLTRPLFFRSEDAGTPSSPTTVEAARGERPVLSGGVQVIGWRKLEEDVPGLPGAAKGHVWVAAAPTFGGRPLEFRQLWVGDRKATRARLSNGDTMERLAGWDRTKREAIIPAALVASLRGPAGVEMFLSQQWEIAILRVKTIRIAGEQAHLTFQEPESQVEFEHPWPQPILPPQGGGAFTLVGAIEFLDQPGEWWQEAPGGRVFYWPRAGEDLSKVPVVAPALATLVEIEGTVERPVAYLRFKGVTFAHTTWMQPAESGHVPLQAGMPLREAYKLKPPGTPDKKALENQAWIGRLPAGVTVQDAHDVAFDRCRFEHCAAAGLDLVRGTHNDVVEGCLFRDVGGNGVQLGNFQAAGLETHVPYTPADEREVCQRERIANNLVTDCANEDWGGVGICAGYVRDVAVEHNEVTNTSYTGISVGWGWTKSATVLRDNRIHANLLRHVATRMCDTAGIYTLSAQPGTTVDENCVEDIAMSSYVDRPDHWFYLYTDEGSSFITVRDNWCPAEKFLKNANGPGNIWERNGPMVPAAIKDAAGLEAAFRDLRSAVAE